MSNLMQDLVGDIHCIIEATIGRNAEVLLDKPNTDGVPKYVLGDPDRLRGILLNLYTNAAKFTKQGFISLRVRVAGHDYRPSPAQVKAQQQHGPRPMHSTALNRQSSEEASQQLLLKQHRVLFALDRSQNASASPFLSNALAIPHLSHTASAMRSQSMRDSQSPHSRQEQGKDVTAIGGAATSGHADAAAKMESPFDEAEAQAQTALLRGQKEHDVAHETMQDAQITTPAACEHIAGQVMLARTAQKISRAANLVRNGMSEGKQEADQMQDSEEHGLQDNESYHQHQAGNSPCGSQSHHSQEPLSSSHQSTQPQQSSTATTAATASAKAYDDTTSQLSTVAEELAGSQTLDAVKRDHSRQSSTCVLDDQPTSSSSSDDARQSATHYRPSTSNGHTQSAPTPYGHNSKHWHSADALPDAHVRTSPHQETNASTPRSSNIGDRSHSSTDLTEHGCQKSSGSFSDYPSPMRRSVSSPGLCEGSEDFFSESSKPNRPTSAVAYNGTASDKATLGGGIVTSIQDLGSGWHNTVAQRRPPRFSASERRNHADPPPAPANAPGDPTQSPFQAASAASAGMLRRSVAFIFLFGCLSFAWSRLL